MAVAATSDLIENSGATPVPADIEPDTLKIDPAAVDAVHGVERDMHS